VIMKIGKWFSKDWHSVPVLPQRFAPYFLPDDFATSSIVMLVV
jgi:hypothetical protein